MIPVVAMQDAVHRCTFPIRDAIDLRIAISQVNKEAWLDQATELDRSVVATIISELGTNIVKYAARGYIDIAFVESRGGASVVIEARDNGPGIADIHLALTDHYTTGKTLGLGLPAVRRMADHFDIQSSPEAGTRVLATKKLSRPSAATPAFRRSPPVETSAAGTAACWDIGTCTRPMPGQIRSGDLAVTVAEGGNVLLAMIDVTGHGERAHELGNRIGSLVRSNARQSPGTLINLLHRSLKATIGAAVGIIAVNAAQARFSYAGVGNIGAARVTGERWKGVPRDGLLGTRLPTVQEHHGALASGDAFLMWSDGIPELLGPRFLASNRSAGAQDVARQLVHTLGKPHDDAGCIVFRWM